MSSNGNWNRNMGNGSNSNQGTNANGSANNGNGTDSRKVIPNEVGDPDCPVCLSRVQNRAYTDTCLHEFCYQCLKEWSEEHNRCPVCREVYRNILHNIRSERDYDREEVEEPFDPTNGMVLLIDNTAIVFTPPTGAYYVNPVPTPFGIRYNILFLGPIHMFVLNNFSENSRLVTPNLLEQTLRDMGARPRYPHNGRHPNGFSHHRHRDQQNGRQQKRDSNE